MGPEVVQGWLDDLNAYSHHCGRPTRCRIPASSSISPSSVPVGVGVGVGVDITGSRDLRPRSLQQPTKRPARRRLVELDPYSNARRDGGLTEQIMSSPAKRRRTNADAGAAAILESEDELASQMDGVGVMVTEDDNEGRGEDEDVNDNDNDNEDDLLLGDDSQATPRASAAAYRTTFTRKGKGRGRGGGRQVISDAPPLSPPVSSSAFTRQLTLSKTSSYHGSQSSRRGPASSSAASRSSSPVKGPDDLLRLEKPVRWLHSTVGDLRKALQTTGGAAVSELFRRINIVTVSRRGFLPLELQPILQGELGLDAEADAHFFAARPPRPVSEQEVSEASVLLGMDTLRTGGRTVDKTLLLLDLHAELSKLRSIVSSTGAFKASPRPEAAWNARIHDRILELAVPQCGHSGAAVGIENVTRAKIAKSFVPTTADTNLDLSLAPGVGSGGSSGNPESKMVDFAMVLHLADSDCDDDDGDDDGDNIKLEGLARRMAIFVSRLPDVPTFNNTTFAPLCLNPAGVFIETKVDTKRYAEAQAQLGIWVSSWFARVTAFSPSSEALPAVPLILAVDESWELWFAVHSAVDTRVYGPLKIGGTGSLAEAYALLSVLRLLVGWVEGPFRDWVIKCLKA